MWPHPGHLGTSFRSPAVRLNDQGVSDLLDSLEQSVCKGALGAEILVTDDADRLKSVSAKSCSSTMLWINIAPMNWINCPS